MQSSPLISLRQMMTTTKHYNQSKSINNYCIEGTGITKEECAVRLCLLGILETTPKKPYQHDYHKALPTWLPKHEPNKDQNEVMLKPSRPHPCTENSRQLRINAWAQCLLSCGFWASNSGLQTWQQVPLPAKPPYWPTHVFQVASPKVCDSNNLVKGRLMELQG